jgi:hypothetical protein
METSTENFSKDERELICPEVVSIDVSNGIVTVVVKVRECFGQSVEKTLYLNQESLNKMLRMIKPNRSN